MIRFDTYAKILKVHEELGLVLGWAIICLEGGEPYFDLQGDHIPEDSMLKAATDFMINSRSARVMHEGSEVGSILYAFPMTEDIKKVFGIMCDKSGLAIAMKPDKESLEDFRSGKLKGFSIGGIRGEDEKVEE